MDAYLATKVKDPKSALAAVMNMTLKHTADVLTMFLEIVSEKYGIEVEEMMDVVSADERFTGLVVDPLLHAAAPAETAEEAAAVPTTLKRRGPKKLSEMTAEERAAHDAKVAARRATAKAAAAEPAVPEAAAPEPAAEPEPGAAPAEAAPKILKTFKIKPKVVQPPEA